MNAETAGHPLNVEGLVQIKQRTSVTQRNLECSSLVRILQQVNVLIQLRTLYAIHI